MGSEICIRDSWNRGGRVGIYLGAPIGFGYGYNPYSYYGVPYYGTCLLYTSDAADERSSVDLGGRRIIKKKTCVNMLADGFTVISIIVHVSFD